MSTGGGVAAIGVGESNSSDRAKDAVMKALQNPLLEVDYTGAAGALVHITGGPDLTVRRSQFDRRNSSSKFRSIVNSILGS